MIKIIGQLLKESFGSKQHVEEEGNHGQQKQAKNRFEAWLIHQACALLLLLQKVIVASL